MGELRDYICVGSDGWPQVGEGARRGGRHFWPPDRRGHCCHEWLRSGPEFSQGQGGREEGVRGEGHIVERRQALLTRGQAGGEDGSWPSDAGRGFGLLWLLSVRAFPGGKCFFIRNNYRERVEREYFLWKIFGKSLVSSIT